MLPKCIFFVVPGNDAALLGILDTEVLGILKITCEVIDSQQGGRKFDSQITWPVNIRKCKTHTAKDHRTGSIDTTKPTNVNSLDYFISSANRGRQRG